MHVHDVRKCLFWICDFAFWSPKVIEHNITQTVDFMEKIVTINLIHDLFWIQCAHFLQYSNLRVSVQIIVEFKNVFRIYTMVNYEVKPCACITIIEFSDEHKIPLNIWILTKFGHSKQINQKSSLKYYILYTSHLNF